MTASFTRIHALAALLTLAWLLAASPARAQDIEPRQYANTPVGVNFLISGYAYTQGGVSSDPALPVTNPDLNTSSAVLGFARSLDFWGRSGKVDFVAPYTWLSGSAELDGEPLSRNVSGFADPRFRVSVNLYGAPSLTMKEFPAFHQDLIVGAALQVSAPWGQYDDTRIVNIGTNRWFFKPSLGVSKAVGPWILEATAAVTLYTDNTDFSAARRGSRIRSMRRKRTSSAASAAESGDRSTPRTSRAAARRWTTSQSATCRGTGALAPRWRCQSMPAIP